MHIEDKRCIWSTAREIEVEANAAVDRAERRRDPNVELVAAIAALVKAVNNLATAITYTYRD